MKVSAFCFGCAMFPLVIPRSVVDVYFRDLDGEMSFGCGTMYAENISLCSRRKV